MSILSTRDLSKSFGGIAAVDGVDFSVKEREIRGIIGPNGAGKTTLVSLLSGRIRPDSGRIIYRGVDITGSPSWKRVRLGIAYTFQITSVYPGLTVYENAAIGAQMRARQESASRWARVRESHVEEISRECLRLTGLESSWHKPAGELAYGHQRLLEIAIGLALDPPLLILDEPTQGLSESEIEEFIRLVGHIRVRKTIILIEHNMPLVMALADRITVMDQGRVLAEDDPARIRQDRRVQEAYLGE